MTSFSYDNPYDARRSPIFARNIVATSQPLAAQAGVRMLLLGGNAVDAALAAAIALTVVEPTANGVGSDAFAIVWDGRELHGLNASGCSPAAWTPERFAGYAQMPERGWESVTVPGAVSAWTELSARFGRLPFEAVFQPAIDYARNGFPVSTRISAQWRDRAPELAGYPGFRDGFVVNGLNPAPGEIVVNAPLARSLEAIAATKGEAFYRGDLARRIANYARAHGAALDLSDLESHQADWCGTISVPFRDIEVHEIPPNGQGIAALIALGILDQTEIETLGPDSPAGMHLQIEAMKLAFADMERYVGDPKAMSVPTAALLDRDYLARRARLIDRKRASVPAAGAPTKGGTVYLTAADASGMMVSYIQSNFAGFGSGVVVPDTGVHLQNRGSGFTLEPGHPNQVGPRKRPFHTIIPGFLMRDAQPLMSFGVMSGAMQAQGHVQMVLRTQVFGQNPQAASDAPRWRVISGRQVAVEWTMPEQTISGLMEFGHEIYREPREVDNSFGGAQLIHRLGDAYVAGSDPRKDGAAVGF
jgi:gamma-glutamyltranspeptidase/glutathione hydrolase